MAVILVTGGAGYIGSHACKLLRAAGHEPVAFDNLVTGFEEAVLFGPFVQGDLLRPEDIAAALRTHRPDAVMHFAALSNVGEASERPDLYWRNNVVGALHLLEAMRDAGVGQLVFSSTCAVYGDHDGASLDETAATRPLNAYGASKLAIEEMIANFSAAHGLRSVIFRYFNVAGADPETDIGERHDPETHLIPIVLEALDGRRPMIRVNGEDYPTPDGTCVRDYIHVMDLVEAHRLGFEHLASGGESLTLNLGTGRGYSIREVIAAAAAVTGRSADVETGPRRPGDAARLVSGSALAEELLGWRPERSDLETMVGDAWAWTTRDQQRSGVKTG